MTPPAPALTLGPPEAPPAVPFQPHAFNVLLRRRPAHAAAILAAMRPALREAQLAAQAALSTPAPAPAQAAWAALLARAGGAAVPAEEDGPACASVYDPEQLALRDAAEVGQLIAALTPPQRVAQAAAQAAWLAGFGYPVALDEVLAGWGLSG